MKQTIEFNGYKCYIKYHRYFNNRTRITLDSIDTGKTVYNCTINDEVKNKIPNQFVFIKDWGENKGIYNLMLKANIIKSYSGKFDVGLKNAYICRLNICRVCDGNNNIENLCDKCVNEILKQNNKL